MLLSSRLPSAVAMLRLLSLNHLVCTQQQRWWDREAERLGGLEVDDQLESRGLQNRQIGRFGAFENPAGIDAKLTICVGNAGSIGRQGTSGGELSQLRNRGQRVAGCKGDDLCALVGEKGIGIDEQRRNPLLDKCCERRVQFAFGAGFDDNQFLARTRPLLPALLACRTSVFGSFGLTRKAITPAFGTSSCSNSISLAASPLIKKLTPVMLPPGRARLATMPSLTGSPPIANTIGTVSGTTGLAATAETVPPVATTTFTRRRTRSAASVGSRSK